MFEYIKYFVFFYLGFYILIHILLHGKVTIGFISWMNLINVRINLKKFKISIGSVSLQIRPTYYLHRKKLKATHHDGLIVIHFFKLHITLLDNEEEKEEIKVNPSIKKEMRAENDDINKNQDKPHFEKCIHILQYIRYILPLTIVMHNLSIEKDEKFIKFETLSTSFNCNLETNKHTKERELKNSVHLSFSNLLTTNSKMIKDLKWTIVGATPVLSVCSLKFSKLISSCVAHGININLDELKQLFEHFKPKKSLKSSSNNNDNNNLPIKKKSTSNIEDFFSKIDKNDIYFAFDETQIESSDLKINVKNMVYSLNSAEKKDIVYRKYSSTQLYKLTMNLSGLNVFINSLKNSKFHVEFFNFFSIWDLKSILYSVKNIHNSDLIKEFTHDDSFIARSFLTITNTTFFTSIDDLILMKKMKLEKRLNNLKKKAKDIEVVLKPIEKKSDTNTDDDGNKSNSTLENILRLTHKLRTRAQLLTSMVQIDLSDSINCQFLIDDILIDSSLTDNLSSLFEMDNYLQPTKSIFLAIRNVQFSVIENIIVHKLLVIDLFDASFSIAVNDKFIVIDSITLYTHHFEILAENIEIFKKLALIANQVVNRKEIITENALIREIYQLENEKIISIPDNNSTKPRRDSLFPRFINNFKCIIHRITITACFKNPVKYWDGEDQSDINNFKRGITFSLLEFHFNHDNTVEIPVSVIKLADFKLLLNRDYDNERKEKNFISIISLQKTCFRYTYINNRLSVMLPLLDITLSVEVLWTIMFILTVLKSLKGRKEYIVDNNIEPINLKPKKKKSNYPLHLLIAFPLIMLRLKLPSDVEIAFEIDSLQFTSLPSVNKYNDIKFKVFRIYGQNAHAEHFWALLAIVSNAHFKITPKALLENNEPEISVDCDDIRIEIPYEYIFYKTFDNLKAFFKSIKKLKLNFHDLMFIEDTQKDFKVDVIMPSLVSSPPRLPKIHIVSKRILYCNHDDPFEEELTAFLMLGRMEQQVRLSKLKAFEKYETNMLHELEEKYKHSIKFIDGIAQIPSTLKIGIQGNLPSPNRSFEMKKSFSTSLLSPIQMNRKISSSVSNGRSRLANEVLTDDCDAWLNYQREYHTSIQIPKNRLNANISKSWITRVKTSARMKKKMINTETNIQSDPKIRKEFLKNFPVVVEGNCQPLFGFVVIDAVLDLDEPEFGLENYPDFIHRVAGGVPKDMVYGILVPMNLKLWCSSMKVQIKDYPLPLVGFGGGKDDGPETVKFEGDMIICEQKYTPDEIRYNFVPCVPQYNDVRKRDSLYAFHIARTMTNVKFISDLNVFVDSTRAAAVSWAPSLQPGMSYAFNSFDLLSKPPLDISSKIGFWDKMPLLVPSKFTFHLKNGIALFIKASQSPYHLIGKNAGFVFKWDKDVKVSVNSKGVPEDFLIVESQVFEIGIPIFDPTYVSSLLSYGMGTALDYKISKVILKLTSKPIIWKLGFLFERNMNNEVHAKPGSVERSKRFRPHWDIHLRNPDSFTNEEERDSWDSYEGWRSDYIYLAVSLYSRDDNKCKELPQTTLGSAFNSLYLTPMAMLYFFFWWNSFKSSLGLPIKAGHMFKNKFLSDAKSPKFGASIFGLTYTVDLSPLYLTHVYQHSSMSQSGSKVAFTGLKCFVKSFTMDLHQCRREVTLLDSKTNSVMKEYVLKMDKGIVDFVDADLRILTAIFNQTSATGMLVKQLGLDKSNTRFSDSDTTSSGSEDYMDRVWYDHNDFVELEAQSVPDEEPKWKVYEFASSPRFYYVRDANNAQLDYPFDLIETQTHNCQLGKRDLTHAASHLVDDRLIELEDQINFHKSEIMDLESKPINDYVKKTIASLNFDLQELHHRLHVLRCLKDRFSEGIFPEYDEFLNDQEESDDEVKYELNKVTSRVSSYVSRTKSRISTAPIQTSNYINRFSIYTINIKWTKQTRTGFLRYLEKVKDRKFLLFSLSQQALSLADELSKSVEHHVDGDPDFSFLRSDPKVEFKKSNALLDDFDQALHDTTGFLEAETQDTYLLKFILPQIAVSSNNNKCVLLTSNQIVLRSISLTGYNVDSGNSEVTLPMETRSGLTLTDAFVYVLDRENVLTNKHRFFTPKSFCWPPKLPIEMYYTPVSLDECVVVQDISCALLYVQPNQLHYTKNDKNKNVRRKETIRIISPEVNLTTDNIQYAVLHDVMMSIFQHDETEIHKVKEAVKNFIKYSDFSNFKVLHADLKDLQNEARQLMECRRLMMNFNFSQNLEIMDDIECINVELEKIFLNINAIVDILQTSKAKKYNEMHEFTEWNIMASTINVSLVSEDKSPFVEVSAIDAYYMFTESPNGESINTTYIQDFAIFDKHPKATCETVVTRLIDSNNPLLKMEWILKAPVGGIRMVEQEHFTFSPLKVEFDMRFAEAIQEFLFPKSKVLESSKVFNDSDDDDLFDDMDSLSSENTGLLRVNSVTSELSIPSEEKQVSKLSKALHKLLPKHNNNSSMKTPSHRKSPITKRNTDEGSISFSGSDNPVSACPPDNVKLMDKRAATYYMANHVQVDPLSLCITFKGTGKLRLVNLSDFKIEIPLIEVRNRMMSNEELFAIIRNKIIHYVLKNTHNVIKSSFKVSKSSKGASSNPLINPSLRMKEKALQKQNLLDGDIHRTSTESQDIKHSHKHNNYHHRFHDTDLLEPTIDTSSPTNTSSKPLALSDLIKQDQLQQPYQQTYQQSVEDDSLFQSLDDVQEEDEDDN